VGGAWVSLGGLLCAIGIGVAAFGAHGLKGSLDEQALGWWNLAGDYLIIGGFGLCLVGVVAHQRLVRAFDNAGLTLFLGTVIFAGTLMGLALGGPRWLGAVTPVGGSLMILGFLIFAWQASRR
jgi:uncharacterized membrane protein YgdD (TMEM256/DUF423 family)